MMMSLEESPFVGNETRHLQPGCNSLAPGAAPVATAAPARRASHPAASGAGYRRKQSNKAKKNGAKNTIKTIVTKKQRVRAPPEPKFGLICFANRPPISGVGGSLHQRNTLIAGDALPDFSFQPFPSKNDATAVPCCFQGLWPWFANKVTSFSARSSTHHQNRRWLQHWHRLRG